MTDLCISLTFFNPGTGAKYFYSSFIVNILFMMNFTLNNNIVKFNNVKNIIPEIHCMCNLIQFTAFIFIYQIKFLFVIAKFSKLFINFHCYSCKNFHITLRTEKANMNQKPVEYK